MEGGWKVDLHVGGIYRCLSLVSFRQAFHQASRRHRWCTMNFCKDSKEEKGIELEFGDDREKVDREMYVYIWFFLILN